MPTDAINVSNESNSQLLPNHEHLLHEAGIDPAIIKQRGYRSLKTSGELTDLGFHARQGGTPALCIPIQGTSEGTVLHLIRPDCPRIRDGVTLVYELPKGSRLRLDVPPGSRADLADSTTRLWIVDSPLQADALASRQETSVAVLGFRGWRHIQKLGQKPLKEWRDLVLKDREVIVAFDSDSVATPDGQREVQLFVQYIERLEAKVRVAIPKPSPSGQRMSISELFKIGATPDGILASSTNDASLAESLIRKFCGEIEHPYLAGPDGLFIRKRTDDGEEDVRLTNWTAKIVANIVQDDGIEQQRFFELEAVILRRVEHFRISPQAFEQLGWVLEELGPEAYTAPGWGIRDHVRAAVQLLSGEVPIRHEFGHTGWVCQNGQWLFLHAGGAIGADSKAGLVQLDGDRPGPKSMNANGVADVGTGGPVLATIVGTVCAQLPPSLSRFSFPSARRERGECINNAVAVILLLKAGQRHITYPLVAAAFRAVLGPTNFSIHLEGESGVYKTAIATVIQQFFGLGLDTEHLVGHWAGTANSLESLAFHLKDVLLLVDDFSPTGSHSDIQRSHREAERLFRAKGNNGGRSRSSSTGAFRAARTPRALLISTGEDVPLGKSLRARILTITVRKGDIDGEFLAHWQLVANQGMFVESMAAFIRWLAPQYDQVVGELSRDRGSWKNDPIGAGVLRRTVQSVRELEFGFCKFLEFAREIGAIDENQEVQLHDECWAALEDIGTCQIQHIAADDPIEHFQSLLSALFSSGRVHVADRTDGGRPLCAPESWGFRKRQVPVQPPDVAATKATSDTNGGGDERIDENRMRDVWTSCGAKIGWVDFPHVYFIPEVLFAELQSLASRNGAPLPFTIHTLEKRLADAEIIMRDRKRGRIRIRITAEGVRQSVLMAYIRKIRWLADFGPDKEESEDHFDMLDA